MRRGNVTLALVTSAALVGLVRKFLTRVVVSAECCAGRFFFTPLFFVCVFVS